MKADLIRAKFLCALNHVFNSFDSGGTVRRIRQCLFIYDRETGFP
jgi:hypothetical protein